MHQLRTHQLKNGHDEFTVGWPSVATRLLGNDICERRRAATEGRPYS